MTLELLKNWQVLLGSLLGGVFALLAAVVVAYRLERRQDLASAMHIVGFMSEVTATYEQLNLLAKQKDISESNICPWYVEKLIYLRPVMSQLFEASVAKILPINIFIAYHITIFHRTYLNIEQKINGVETDLKNIQRGEEADRSYELIKSDVEFVYRNYELAAYHADCAMYLLTKLVLSKFSCVNSIIS